LAIISCTLSLPTELVEIHVVVVNTHVEGLEKPTTPKLVPLVILEIGVIIEVILIDTITHASKVFKTPNIILKETLVAKRLGSQLAPLAETLEYHM